MDKLLNHIKSKYDNLKKENISLKNQLNKQYESIILEKEALKKDLADLTLAKEKTDCSHTELENERNNNTWRTWNKTSTFNTYRTKITSSNCKQTNVTVCIRRF